MQDKHKFNDDRVWLRRENNDNDNGDDNDNHNDNHDNDEIK